MHDTDCRRSETNGRLPGPPAGSRRTVLFRGTGYDGAGGRGGRKEVCEHMLKVKGGASEPVELRAGAGVREAAREVELEQWAWRKVKGLRLLYTHLTLYVFINIILLLIDVSTPGEAWFYKVILGWGLLVGLHAAHTYELLPWSTRDWEQRKVRQLMEDQRQRRHRS